LISRLLIRNFRSIEHCDLSLRNLNAFVGENNAGKTNILRALKTVLGGSYVSDRSFSVEDYHCHDTEKDIEISLFFDPPLTYQKYGQTYEIPQLQYLVTSYKRNTSKAKKGDVRFVQQCLGSDGELITVLSEAPKAGKKNEYEKLATIPAEIRDQLPVIYIGTDRSLEDQLPSKSTSVLFKLFLDVDKAIKTTEFEPDTNEPKRSHHDIFLERLAEALNALKVKEFTDLEELLRTKALENLGLDPSDPNNDLKFEFSLFNSLDFLKAIELSFRERGKLISADCMGDGTKNALILALFQAYEATKKQGAIFLIEEPEIFLHPHRRRHFYKTLKNISVNNQVLYTTHSPEFVDVADYQNLHLVCKSPNGQTYTRRTNSKRTEKEIEDLRSKIDVKRSEIFFANHVYLVEGDTEELALPEYAKRLGIDLDSIGHTIVNVRGKPSILSFAEILFSFGIPFSIMFDTDPTKTAKDNLELNDKLRNLADANVTVTEMNPDFEGVVSRHLGQERYNDLLNKFPHTSKQIKQRLIAIQPDVSASDEIRKFFGLEPQNVS